MTTFFDAARLKIAEVMNGLPEVFTPEWLDTATKALASKITSNGDDSSIVYWARQQCWTCGFFMRMTSTAEARFIGPIRPNPFRTGDVVTIPAGAVIRKGRDLVATKRATRVTISSIREGRTDTHHAKPVVFNPSIVWMSGSARCEYDLGRNPLPVAEAHEQIAA